MISCLYGKGIINERMEFHLCLQMIIRLAVFLFKQGEQGYTLS